MALSNNCLNFLNFYSEDTKRVYLQIITKGGSLELRRDQHPVTKR